MDRLIRLMRRTETLLSGATTYAMRFLSSWNRGFCYREIANQRIAESVRHAYSANAMEGRIRAMRETGTWFYGNIDYVRRIMGGLIRALLLARKESTRAAYSTHAM